MFDKQIVTLSAEAMNNKLPAYCLLVPDPMAWKQDPFQHPIGHLQVYMVLPFALIRRVLNRVMTASGLYLIMLFPLWPCR